MELIEAEIHFFFVRNYTYRCLMIFNDIHFNLFTQSIKGKWLKDEYTCGSICLEICRRKGSHRLSHNHQFSHLTQSKIVIIIVINICLKEERPFILWKILFDGNCHSIKFYHLMNCPHMHSSFPTQIIGWRNIDFSLIKLIIELGFWTSFFFIGAINTTHATCLPFTTLWFILLLHLLKVFNYWTECALRIFATNISFIFKEQEDINNVLRMMTIVYLFVYELNH